MIYINIETLKNIAWIVTAFAGIISFAWCCFMWFHKQNETSERVDKLEDKEEDYKKEIEDKHDKDIKGIQSELCMLNYGLLAALDALIQQGYNGEVKIAREKVSKHINQQAHDQV